ncbi:MAG: hypothetical protein CMJ39_09635 [Phycisphaerae bacterium]|nr:hypothetical protein [Phycisphaerae bacterium]
MNYEVKQRPRPSTNHLELRHQVLGTAHATVFDEETWYVLQGCSLLILDPATGRVINQLNLDDAGGSGPAVDPLVEPGVIHVVLKDTDVVVLDRTDPLRPFIERRTTAAELGIQPRALNRGRVGPIVSGIGGAVQLPHGHRLIDHEGEVTSVIDNDQVSIYTMGRRVYRQGNDEYVGSATRLAQLPESDEQTGPSPAGIVLPEGSMFFIRNESTGGLAGFACMQGGLLREVDSTRTTEAFRGGVRQLRMRGDRVLIAGSRSVHLYRLSSSGELIDLWSQEIPGARSVDFIDDRDIVVVGEFGCIRYRTDRVSGNVVARQDAPGGLVQAISDGRRIMATGVDGTWEYQIGHEAELVEVPMQVYPPPARQAAVLGWKVKISSDGRHADIQNKIGSSLLPAPIGSRFITVASGDGTFWLGHENGVMMIKPPSNLPMIPVGWEELSPEEKSASGYSPLEGIQKLTIHIDGPVIFLQPLDLGGGVGYASGNGGFGVVREVF